MKKCLSVALALGLFVVSSSVAYGGLYLMPPVVDNYIGYGIWDEFGNHSQDTLENVDLLLDANYYPHDVETFAVGKLEDGLTDFSWEGLSFNLSDYGPTGTWSVEVTGTTTWNAPIWFSVKSACTFSLHDSSIGELTPGSSSGDVSWSTYATNQAGYPQDLSHISFWTERQATPVPEPGMLLLFGTAMAGFAIVSKKRIK